jgi:ACS family D-galactonate transporter-like MFS transporter
VRRDWTVVMLVFVFMLINYADKAVVGLSSVPIMRELGLTRTQFGLLGSAFFLLFSVSGIVVGFMTHRVKSHAIMGTMAVIWAAAMLAVSVVPGFAMLLGSRVVLGAAEGPAFPVAMHSVYKWFGDRDRAVPSSIVAIGPAFGAGILAPLITQVIVGYGWRAAFAVLGASGLTWVILWLSFGREGSVDLAGARSAGGSTVSYRRLLLNRTALGVYAAGFAAYTLIALSLVWLANYLIEVLHMSPQHASLCVALPSALQIAFATGIAFGSRWLSRRGVSGRLSRGLPGAWCVIIAGTCVMSLPLASSDAWRIVLLGVGFSIGSVIFTLGPTLLGEIAPARQRGALLGVANSVHAAAGLLTPVVIGLIIDLKSDPANGFRSGFLCLGGFVAALGIAAALLIDPDADARRLGNHCMASA